MARKKRSASTQPEQQPDSAQSEATEISSESIAPEGGESLEPAPLPPLFESFDAATPAKPNLRLISLHEAIHRYVDDSRYRSGWDLAISRHAQALGHRGDCTAEDWLNIFSTFGLKVRE